MNAVRLLDIDEAAEMLQCSVAKVRQMVISDRTLAAVHENYQGFRTSFKLGGLRLFDVDVLGVISVRGRGREPAGFLRFDLAEVVRVLSEQAHWEANAAPLSELFPNALKESESSALACGGQPLMALSPIPEVAETVGQRRARYLYLYEAEAKREKRGAYQRSADSLGIDRANMQKDINKARDARAAQTRNGDGWLSQLVQKR